MPDRHWARSLRSRWMKSTESEASLAPAPEGTPRDSGHAARAHDPFAALTGDRRDGGEVGVVVRCGDVELFGCRCDEQVRDLAPTLAALGEQALHLVSARRMRCGRLDWFERVECFDEPIRRDRSLIRYLVEAPLRTAA